MLRIPVIAAVASIAAASTAFALGDTTRTSSAGASSSSGAIAGATAYGGRGGSAKQGQAQGQIQGQTSVQKTNQDTRQLNKQSAESNSGGNTQGTTVEGDNVEGSFAFGYAAPSVAVQSNNVIGTTEAITTGGFQFPAIGGAVWWSEIKTTIGGVPLVVEALKIAGDPEYAAAVTKTTALGPDTATSRAYAAVMCVNFEDEATAYGLTCE